MSTVLAGDEYVFFCKGLRALCQVDLLQYKRCQMERRIRALASRRGIERLADYLALLRTREEELEAFLARITINVSQLWRNPEQWELLARSVLPELATAGRLRAWSAGCSYGAEPYTLAAVCLDTIPDTPAEIRGTDIDARMIALANVGRFSAEDARSAPPELLHRFFEPDGDGWLARPELRRLVSFDTGDLLRMPVCPGHYDLVLCRNTAIYFTEQARDELYARMAVSLRSGGYLMVGATERVSSPTSMGLAYAHPFVYRRV